MPERPLDPGEKLLFLCDRVSPFNVVFVLSIEGNISLEDCRYAIRGIQEAHPLLRVKIGRSWRRELKFLTDLSLEPALIGIRDDVSKIEAYVEGELMARFDPDTGPLIRFTLIQHEERVSTLLITAHHSIGDGLSGCILAKDFLQILAGGKLAERRKSLPDPVGMRMPSHLCGMRGLFLHVRELIRAVGSSLKNGAPAALSVISADLAERTPLVALRTVDPSQLNRMLANCRANGCSMQGVLGAALLLAIKANIVPRCETSRYRTMLSGGLSGDGINRSSTLQLLSPVNIRKKLVPVIEEEFGLYVVTQTTNHRLTTETMFWTLASEISQKLRGSINADAPMAFMPFASRYLAKMMGIGDRVFGGVRFSRWLCSTFPPSVALSNLGPIDVPHDYGDIRLRGLGFLASLSGLGSISSFALTFSERLSWNFVAMTPSLDREHLEAVADDSMRYLFENALTTD